MLDKERIRKLIEEDDAPPISADQAEQIARLMATSTPLSRSEEGRRYSA